MKKTKWFPASEKPVSVGWYECKSPLIGTSAIVLRWWDGKNWRASPKSVISLFSLHKKDKWRGLTEEAK